MNRLLSTTDMIVIGITLVLFLVALFIKGLTKELLIEAAVMLVSVKLIMMNHKTTLSNKKILEDLEEIKETLSEIKKA